MKRDSFPSRNFSGRLCAGFFLLLVIAMGASAPRHLVAASPPPLREYDVKAACLFNIAKFSDWPAQAFTHPAAPLIIGILGEDPFGSVLDRIVKGRLINERPVVIRRAAHFSELKNAHVVFISAALRGSATQICTALEETHVLCVGDSEETEPVAAINFSVVAGRTVFTVNLSHAHRAGVRISSKLLALAQVVRGPR